MNHPFRSIPIQKGHSKVRHARFRVALKRVVGGNFTSGQLLLEVLIAIGLIAITGLIVLVALQTGPKTTQTANVQSRATELAREAQEIVRDIANRSWLGICDVQYAGCQVTSSLPYYPTSTTGEWTLVSGSETKTLANTTYTRTVVIDKVCRDDATGAISASGVSCPGGSTDDPSTRKVTATVSVPGSDPIILVSYLTRWGRKDALQTYAQNCASFQTDWSGGVSSTASATGTVPCVSPVSFGNFFSNAWYQLTTSTSLVTSTDGIEYQKIPGSLFVEPQP